MSGDRWVRISELFEAALSLGDEERDAFVRKASAGDATVVDEVRSLLEAHARAGGFLEPGQTGLTVPPGPLDSPDDDPAEPAAGSHIGPWQIVRELGRGGMGVVWLVDRADGGFRQQGALKQVRSGFLSDEMLRRFRRERQILASLEHPHIARLMDGGTTAEGHPYLVMEPVEGKTLYLHCTENRIGLEGRLALFLTLAEAVQYAHQHLVLHRDIKPSNILVTKDGTLKLLDFGVAKMFADEDAGRADELRTISLPLTPEYASPEQIRGESVGTASDVYSLGVVFYELLTGLSPYPVDLRATHERMRAALEHVPERPSAAITRATAVPASRHLPAPPDRTPSLRRRLSGDLDTIALKALQKDPGRRYATAEEMADDVRRFLGGRPVRARPDAWSYRAAKFVGRNRAGVAAAAVAGLALISGLGVSLWQAAVARQQRSVAEARFRELRSLANTLIFDVHDAVADLPGATQARELILDRAVVYLDRLSREAGRDTALRRELAEAWDRIGTVQGQVWSANVGKGEEARASLTHALDLREGLLRENPDDPGLLFATMASHSKLGNYDNEHGRHAEAVAHQRRALACIERLLQTSPDDSVYRAHLPRRLHNLGLALWEAGQVREGLEYGRRALAGFSALAARYPEDWRHQRAWAQSAVGYADALMRKPGDTDSAIVLLHRAAAIYAARIRERPDDVDSQRRMAGAHAQLARIWLFRLAQPESAYAWSRRVAAGTHAGVIADSGNDDARVSDLIARTEEGYMAANARRVTRAEQLLIPATAELEQRWRADSTDVRFPASLVEAKAGLGIAGIARARAARGPAARLRWTSARDHLRAASGLTDRLHRQGNAWDLMAEQSRILDRALAVCDSALGPSRP